MVVLCPGDWMKGKGCTSSHLSLTSGNRPFFLHRSETSPNLTALLHQDTAARTSVSVLDFYIFFSFCLLGNMSHFQLITNTRRKSKGNFFVFQKCIQNFTTYTSGSCKQHVGSTFTMAGGQETFSLRIGFHWVFSADFARIPVATMLIQMAEKFLWQLAILHWREHTQGGASPALAHLSQQTGRVEGLQL